MAQGLANTAIGSFLGGFTVIPAAAIGASGFLAQLPGPADGTTVTAAGGGLDNTKFAKPGWWTIGVVARVKTIAVPTAGGPRMMLIPWDTRAKAFQLRPFQGVKAGAFTVPIQTFWNPEANASRDFSFTFDTYFPEPWCLQFDAGFGMGVGERLDVVLQAMQHCVLDDTQAAIDPLIAP